jgi:hypothetical protein
MPPKIKKRPRQADQRQGFLTFKRMLDGAKTVD